MNTIKSLNGLLEIMLMQLVKIKGSLVLSDGVVSGTISIKNKSQFVLHMMEVSVLSQNEESIKDLSLEKIDQFEAHQEEISFDGCPDWCIVKFRMPSPGTGKMLYKSAKIVIEHN